MLYCIYKIVCDDLPNFIYVGSTKAFRQRKALHKSCCNNEKQNGYNNKLYKTIRENGGWEKWRMVCIAETQVDSKRQAEIVEEEWRLKLQANLNGKRCYTTEEQKKELKKEYDKEYYENNKEHRKDYHKEWFENNKEQIKEYKKDYRETNAEQLKEYRKDYYENNKEKINKKCNCECGGKYTYVNKATHLNSAKHQAFLSRPTEPN